MRIIRSSKSKRSKITRVIECRECRCEFEIQSGDESLGKLVHDSRDGDFYQLPCPECKIINNIDAPLFS